MCEEKEFNQYLSFVDLERDPEFVIAWKEQDQKKVEELLYKYGCDLTHGYEIQVGLHRPRTRNSVDYGPRFTFVSRVDKEWQPYMTTEELIAATGDSFLKSDLTIMSKQSNFSGDLMDMGEDDEETSSNNKTKYKKKELLV